MKCFSEQYDTRHEFFKFFFFKTDVKETSEQYAAFLILSKNQQVSSDRVH